MALWTDIIDPATLTGYARASQEAYEQSKGSLADYLPNQTINDIVARVTTTPNGLVETAKFRAYDAEIEPGKLQGGARKIIELPALGQYLAVTEYDQLRLRNATDQEMLQHIQRTTDTVVTAIEDRMEYMRGVVLATGKATIDQANFKTEDDFGRDADMSKTATNLWSTEKATILDDLQAWQDLYIDRNGEAPGAIVTSNKVLRAIAKAAEFKTQLINGASRPASTADVQAVLDGYDLPPIRVYDRRVQVNGVATRVLPETNLFFLPAAGQSSLGASYWGRTLTSTDLNWGLEGADQAGIVSGVFRNEKPPVIAEVFGDAIGLPILANANLAFTAKVL